MTIILWTLAILLVVIGFVGIVLPALPGHVLIFAGLLLAAWADGFDRVGPIMLTVIGVIGAASYGVDVVESCFDALIDNTTATYRRENDSGTWEM